MPSSPGLTVPIGRQRMPKENRCCPCYRPGRPGTGLIIVGGLTRLPESRDAIVGYLQSWQGNDESEQREDNSHSNGRRRPFKVTYQAGASARAEERAVGTSTSSSVTVSRSHPLKKLPFIREMPGTLSLRSSLHAYSGQVKVRRRNWMLSMGQRTMFF